ncbi:MAG: peptidylprolyl isomerase [Thermoleophilia bacterium]
MTRLRVPLLALLAALLLALAAGCGGDDDGGADAGGGDAPAASAPEDVVTNFAGDTCSAAEPDPPPHPSTYGSPPEMTIDPATTYTATLETSCGTIVIALDAEAAPLTVNNFVFLAREGFYDGLTFHRVVTGFVIQGGDPEGDGRGGPGYEFEDELPEDGYPAGSVAMANSGPDTNGSQFFIVTGEAPLPNAYSRFGTVTEGLDVARTIEAFADPQADPGDPASQTPASPVYIHSVTITES